MTLSKRDWLAATQCLAMPWYARRSERPPLSEATRFRMQQGQEVGAAARSLFPEGIFVMPTAAESAAAITARLLTEPTNQTLFEATFAVDGLTAKADIVRRDNDGWHLIEVKSSFADTGDTADLVADLTYTTMVMQRVGVPVLHTSLMLLSRTYRHGMAFDQLFETLDKTDVVRALLPEFDSRIGEITTAVFGDTRPTVVLCRTCRQCQFFVCECLGVGHEHTVLELPNLHHKKFRRLADEGFVGLADVPLDLELTERQQRVKDAALSGTMFVAPALIEAIRSIQWPCHYLDFETIATVMPMYPGHACHQQVPTQFSVHHRDTLDAEPTHSEYLADARQPDERRFVETLLAVLGTTGSIIVYSSFEKTRLKAMQAACPDLHENVEGILGRLVDLNAIVTAHVYHPAFRGSTSIKTVLPTLVPDLSYDDLVIRDGDAAMTVFARMAREEMPEQEIAANRTRLLEYCGRDTLALVRLHEALAGMVT